MMDLVTFDWETYYDKIYSLSKMSTEAYVRDERFEEIGFGYKINDGGSVWVTGNFNEIHREVKDLKLEKRAVLCHHTAFDGLVLSQRHNVVAAQYFDTLSMARALLGSNGGCSLAALAKRFILGEKGTEVLNAIGKRRADFSPLQLKTYGEYCKNDADLTYLLFNIMRQFSTPQEMFVIDLMLRMYIDPVLELDRDLLEEHLVKVVDKKDKLLATVEEIVGKDGLMSNDKLATILKGLNVDPPMKLSEAKTKNAKTNPSGEPVYTYAFGKTDEEFKALLEHDDVRVQTVVAARMGVKSTLEETRTQALLGIKERGLLPIPLAYYAAHTGRAGGWDKINMQNLPRGGALRRAIRPLKGHKIVACDSAQIEARVVAWWAGQEDLVEAFARGADIYSEFASDVYGYAVNRKLVEIIPATGKEWHPFDEEGRVGKTSILGLGFGMGKDKFLVSLKKAGVKGKDIFFSEGVVNLYRAKYAAIGALWKDCQRALRAVCDGFETEIGVGIKLKWDQDGIHLPNGMLIRYKNLRKVISEETGKVEYVYDGRAGATRIYGAKIVENVVQALARIIVFNQMCMIQQKLRALDHTDGRYRVALTVHDEVVGICPTHYVNELKIQMISIMKIVPKWAAGLPITCEAASGDSYGDCK
jgi:DNA polymerase